MPESLPVFNVTQYVYHTFYKLYYYDEFLLGNCISKFENWGRNDRFFIYYLETSYNAIKSLKISKNFAQFYGLIQIKTETEILEKYFEPFTFE